MKKLKQVTALALAGSLLAASLAGCGSAASGGASAGGATQESASTGTGTARPTSSGQADNSLTIPSVGGEVSNLDPELYTQQVESDIVYQVYEPLFYMDNDGNDVNLLIDSYTENDDGSVDFVLKSDVKFHSGDTLKAEDVEYTLSRCESSPLCSQLYGNIEMTTTDDTHFTWTFPNEGAGFQDLKTYIELMAIVNKSYCETVISNPGDDLGLNVDGTGPYRFVEKSGNGDVTLERFADYHGEASIDKLYFKHLTGNQETAFESGDLDLAQYTATNFPRAQAFSNVKTESYARNAVTMLITNCTEGAPTSDLRVRQAIAYCLNREDVTAVGAAGAGTPAYNLANPLVQHYADVCDHFDQNYDQANALMSEAGYSASNPLELTMIVLSSNTDWVSACEIMKEELEQSYFKINIEQVTDQSRYIATDFDLGVISIALTTQFSSFAAMFQPDSGIDLAGIDDPTILDAFTGISDEASVQNAMKAATESMAYIPLFYSMFFYAFDGNLNTSPIASELSGFLYREFSWK